MLKLMQKKLNKKGFTLAELLIVVAIIAILVAIAMPIFFGALDNAKEQAFNANVRSLKAVGVNEILTHSEEYDASNYPAGWVVTGELSENGDFSNVTISNSGTATTYESYKTNPDSITVILQETDVTKTP